MTMNLGLADKYFIVCGASDGFGKAVATALLAEGADVLLIARNNDKLDNIKEQFPEKADTVRGDLQDDHIIDIIFKKLGNNSPDGILINAGGPPVKSFLETRLEDWDTAYNLVLRWKIGFIKAFLPMMMARNYGRVLFIESISVKQPVANLVLSTAFRLAVAGMVKTLSQEVGSHGITLNILAPGYHNTNALKRVIENRAKVQGIGYDEAVASFVSEIPVKRLGTPNELASLALWLLSPLSGYITGQTITVDGGKVQGIFG